jgi:hypothetical protein
MPRLDARVHLPGASLRFIGEQRLPWCMPFMGTTVGGLSGIDYDPASGNWIMVSDDRSEINPARYYTARLDYDAKAFNSVTLTGVHYLRQGDGTLYPGEAAGQGEIPDLETIRFDPHDGTIWYGSEGRLKLGFAPFIRHAAAGGRYLGSLPLPAMFRNGSGGGFGARDNLSIEGISFAADGASLWLGMEAPLLQDGPLSTAQQGALARITRLDRSGNILAQYAYPVDAIPFAAAPGRLSDNGVSEVLAIDERHLWVVERAGSEQADGTFQYRVRLYEADLSRASDIQHMEALPGQAFRPATKRLVLNLDALPLGLVGNVEGIAWGDRLANGNDTLVLVSDDNFKRGEVTQLLLFEVERISSPLLK